MSGIVGSRLNIRGSGIVGSIGTDGQVLTSAGAGQEIVFEDAGGGAVSALNNATANEVVTVGSTTTELDAEANLTFDGTDLTLGTGDLVFGTSGKGVVLGVTSNNDVNTLDDYEEGTWSPSLSAATGDLDVASTHTMYYRKVGRIVTCFGSLQNNGHGAGAPSGNISCTVPFTCDSYLYGGGYALNGFIDEATNAFICGINPSSTDCYLYGNSGTGIEAIGGYVKDGVGYLGFNMVYSATT